MKGTPPRKYLRGYHDIGEGKNMRHKDKRVREGGVGSRNNNVVGGDSIQGERRGT